MQQTDGYLKLTRFGDKNIKTTLCIIRADIVCQTINSDYEYMKLLKTEYAKLYKINKNNYTKYIFSFISKDFLRKNTAMIKSVWKQ